MMREDYYCLRTTTVPTRWGPVVMVGKPGVWSWDALNPGSAALIEVLEVRPGQRVLELACGTGIMGTAVAAGTPDTDLLLLDSSVAAVRCARATLAANAAGRGAVCLADDALGLATAQFDRVLCHLPRGRAVMEALLEGSAWALRPGGRLYFVAHTSVGVKGAIRYADELFGRAAVVRRKAGYHVALAERPAQLALPPLASGYVRRALQVDGRESLLVSKPGVFAWDRLDDGTAALIQAMQIDPSDHVLDLGCGPGLAGLAAARKAERGQVVLVDVDVRAVSAARRTLAANDVSNARVLASDCASAVRNERFDVVITNPPFHQGSGVDYEVARQFVRDAAAVLHPGGRLFLVANRFIPYQDAIRAAFGNVDVAYADRRYHVLTATR